MNEQEREKGNKITCGVRFITPFTNKITSQSKKTHLYFFKKGY